MRSDSEALGVEVPVHRPRFDVSARRLRLDFGKSARFLLEMTLESRFSGQFGCAGMAKFEDVKAQLAKQMEQSKKNQVRAALDKQLRQNAKIEEQ